MRTELCERLGIQHPIFSVGFGQIVRDIVREAEAVIDRLRLIRTSPEPVPAG